MSMTDSGVTSQDSTTNLLRLFGAQSSYQVVTRKDLAADYDDVSSTSSNYDATTATTINNYYTWNSPKTYAQINKEKAAIVSAIHEVKSTSLPPSLSLFLSPSKSFTRSHRIEDIVSMCSDGRDTFSADEYHNTDANNHRQQWTPPDNGRSDAEAYDWRSDIAADTSCPLLERCWSCTATYGSEISRNAIIEDNRTDETTWKEDNNEPTSEVTTQPMTWKQKFTRFLFRNKNSRQ